MYSNTQIIGNLGRDPEMSYTPSGVAVTRFSLAVNRKWTDSATKEKREETTWWRVTCFGNLAETANNFLRKGSKAFVEGRASAHAWIDKEGQAQAGLELTADHLVLLDPKGSTNGDAPAPATAASGAKAIGPGETANADDLPF